jgi:hypothetical protein
VSAPVLLTARAAARFLGLGVGRFYSVRYAAGSTFPKARKVPGMCEARYVKSELIAWARSLEEQPTKDVPRGGTERRRS